MTRAVSPRSPVTRHVRPSLIPPAARQLVGLLQTARSYGTIFDTAWTESLRHITWPTGITEHIQEERVIEWSRPYFRNAYEHPEERPRWLDAILHPALAELEDLAA